jgi:hypothetical protein
MDWLQIIGNMNVNSVLKRLSFLHQGKSLLLQGIQASSIPCQPITISRLEALMSTHASILVDSVGSPSAEVYRTASSFP